MKSLCWRFVEQRLSRPFVEAPSAFAVLTLTTRLYRAEIDAMRAKGQKICEFTRLAVDASTVSRPVLAGLFHTVYLFARNVRAFDFVVIEVNPRHVGYYRRSLGFDILGEAGRNLRVNAPAVLMGMSFRKICDNMHRYAGRGARPRMPRVA